jgi:hypothetical protein
MAEAPDGADRPRPSLARRLAPLILVAGALASAIVFIPKMPRERHVELRLDDPATIVGLRLEWAEPSSRLASPLSAAEEDLIRGTTWRFEAGLAPPSVTATISLPDGPYDLDILVERVERTDAVHRSLKLGDADRIAVSVR